MEKEQKASAKARLGEMLLEACMINQEQLKTALDRQVQLGGRVGSILEELGYLSDESLLGFLGKQSGIRAVSLFDLKIEAAVLNLLPFEKVKALRVLPIKETGTQVTLAMENPFDMRALQEIEFHLGRGVSSVIVPSFQMAKAIAYLEGMGYGRAAFDGAKIRPHVTGAEGEQGGVHSLLKLVVENGASDLHLTADVAPSIRVDTEVKRLALPALTAEQTKWLARELLSADQREIFERDKEIDFALSVPDVGRFRINMYNQRGSISLAARLVVEDIPTLAALGLPEWLREYALMKQGFILITGPSGHGKTTTLSALVNLINENRRCNVVTLEDPIEYLHKHKLSNVNQREIGIDTESFSEGLKHIFRQDPDVIVIGEMRDAESISIALTAAETGHLVLSTLHTTNTTSAVDRIIDIFPGRQQHQVRMQFADCFQLVLGQRLVPKKKGAGRVLAYEKMTNSFRVRNLIREEKTQSIRSFMQVSSKDISSIDQSLARLFNEGKITLEDGLKYCDNPAYLQELTRTATNAAA